MAGYKRVVLTEQETTTQVDNNYQQTDVQKQMDKFESTYTSKKLNELYNQFDAITFNDVNTSTIVKENAVVATKSQADFKTVVYLTTAIIVTLLLAFLAIYNIFVINGLNSSIQLLQEEVTVAETQLNALNSNELTEEQLKTLIASSLSGNYQDITSNGFADVTMLETTSGTTYEIETNWFDELCGFLSSVFGG